MAFLNPQQSQGQPQSTEQQTQTFVPPNLLAPVPPPPQQDFFRFRIQSEDFLEELEHKLKGEIWIPNAGAGSGGKWEKKYARWVNDEGISVIVSIVYDYANKNTYLGNLKKDEIFYMCRDLKKKLAVLLCRNYVQFEIEKSKRSLVLKKVVDTVHSALSRCEDGKEANQLSTATQRHEIYQQRMPEEDKGMLRRFLPKWGNR